MIFLLKVSWTRHFCNDNQLNFKWNTIIMKKLLFLQKQDKSKIIILLAVLFSLFFSSISFAVIDRNPMSKDGIVIKHDQRPTHQEYAMMSKLAYEDLQEGAELRELPNWKVYEVRKGSSGYYGVVFHNKKTQQLVLAHRGTNSLESLWEDVKGIVLKQYNSPQKFEAYTFTKEILREAQRNNYNLNFTGHSLGAFLAELSVFYCYKDFKYMQASAVAFDSPGGYEILSMLQPNIPANEIQLKFLDIINYVSEPNLVNTFGKQIGTVCHIKPNLENYNPESFFSSYSYTKESHSIDRFVEYLSKNYSSTQYMVDWPKANWDGLINEIKSSKSAFFRDLIKNVSINPFSWATTGLAVAAGIGKTLGSLAFYACFHDHSKQKTAYFKHVSFDDKTKMFNLIIEHDGESDQFSLTYDAHFQPDEEYDPSLALPLKHFDEGMQRFLLYFNQVIWGVGVTNKDREKFIEQWKKIGIPPEITTYLIGLRVEKNNNEQYIVNLEDIKFGEDASIAPIYKFRSELSAYLSQNQNNIKAILEILSELDKRDIYTIGDIIKFEGNVINITVNNNLVMPDEQDKIDLLLSLFKNDVPTKSFAKTDTKTIKNEEDFIQNRFNFKREDRGRWQKVNVDKNKRKGRGRGKGQRQRGEWHKENRKDRREL